MRKKIFILLFVALPFIGMSQIKDRNIVRATAVFVNGDFKGNLIKDTLLHISLNTKIQAVDTLQLFSMLPQSDSLLADLQTKYDSLYISDSINSVKIEAILNKFKILCEN